MLAKDELQDIIQKHALAQWNGWDKRTQCLCGEKLGIQRWPKEQWQAYSEHLAQTIWYEQIGSCSC